MERASPGVVRAIQAASGWADRLSAPHLRPLDLVLALLDDDDGRPAALVARLGLVRADLQNSLIAGSKSDDPAAPSIDELCRLTSAWSLLQLGDANFTTDAFLLSVLRTEPHFQAIASNLGLATDRIESTLLGTTTASAEPESASRPFLPQFEDAEKDAARVVDANLNRAREATRVLEDYCRFVLDDAFLSECLKKTRHELAEASSRFSPHLLLQARNTLGDVGTTISASNEYDRSSAKQVAQVNLKRLQEALRSLEEFGKVFGSQLGQRFESLRYHTYTLERALLLGVRARERLGHARLYLLLSGASCPAALDWTIAQAAAGGVDIVQLREKSLVDRDLLARARDVRRWTRQAGVLFIVNDRPDIAKLAEADGVHLGQDDLSVSQARGVLGPDALIGVSTHSIEQVRLAILDGADYLGLGPTFPSRTKNFEQFPGLDFLCAASRETSLPAFALGGIGPENIEHVVATGVRRVAVSAAITQSDEPELITRLLRAVLDR